jgi:hypothetical protein
MNFSIISHVELDSRNRAICPSCKLSKGEGHSKRNLSVNPENGAYKCFAGCTPEDIRSALGEPKAMAIPEAIATKVPQKPITVSSIFIEGDHQYLVGSQNPAIEWLEARGITRAIAEHYQLGLTTRRIGKPHPCIVIPLPAPEEKYYQKLRVRPWGKDGEVSMPWHQKGIPAMAWITHNPEKNAETPEIATETWLCEGEWDAMLLGYLVAQQNIPVAVACFTCGCGTVPPADQLQRLPGERVIIFYDRNDKPTVKGRIPGDEGAKKVAKVLGDRGYIGKVPMPSDCTVNGWDVTNALQDGFTVNDFITAAAEAQRPVGEKTDRVNPLRSHLVSNDELMERAPDYVEWLVNDILTANELFLLAAPPRGGKSLFAMGLSKAVACGHKFLDRPTMQGPVIYVNLEDADAKIKERVEAQQWPAGTPVHWLDSFKLSQLPDLIDIIEDIQPRLVVLDTMTRIRSEGVSESSAEIGLVLEPLQECSKRCNTCILLIHHTKKINIDEGDLLEAADQIRGSSAIRATCRGTLVIAPGKESYRLVAENGFGKHDLAVRIDTNTLEWKLLGKWSPMVNESLKDKALDYLNKVGDATCEQIALETASPVKTMHLALSRLVADGLIEKYGNRRGAIYRRAIHHIHQMNSLMNSGNEDGEKAKGAYSSKKNIFSFKGDDEYTTDTTLLTPSEKDNFLMNRGENGCNPLSESKNVFITYSSPIHHDEYNSDDQGCLLQDASHDQRETSGSECSTDCHNPTCDTSDCHKTVYDTSALSTTSNKDWRSQNEFTAFQTLPNGEVCDCHVKVKRIWRQAKYYRDLGTMRLSPTTKKLEACHRVAIAKGDHDVTWLEVAEPELRRGEV